MNLFSLENQIKTIMAGEMQRLASLIRGGDADADAEHKNPFVNFRDASQALEVSRTHTTARMATTISTRMAESMQRNETSARFTPADFVWASADLLVSVQRSLLQKGYRITFFEDNNGAAGVPPINMQQGWRIDWSA